MPYILSIIIPTKNRYEYLKECLLSLKKLNSEKVEIIVQDNTVNNYEIVDFIEKLNTNNIKYYYDPSELSQTDNSDLAAKHATGEYCTYIGDDDSVCSAMIDSVEYMKKQNIDSAVINLATYHWPDVVFQGKKQPCLFFDRRKPHIRYMNKNQIFKDFLSWGCQDIHYIPRVYHGIIKRSVMEKIKDKTGSYFPGPSPDMANATAALLVINSFIEIPLPLIVSGYSYKSAGGMGLRGAHTGSLKATHQLPKNAEQEWSSKIPKVWLGYTVWAEAAEKAFTRMGESNYIEKINYNAMLAKTFLRYRDYRNMVMLYFPNPTQKIVLFYECLRFMSRWSWRRLLTCFYKVIGMIYENHNTISLQEACSIVNDFNRDVLRDTQLFSL